MKNKKLLAIALSVSIFISSFSGVYISYAKNGNDKEDVVEGTSKAPIENIIELEPELNSQANEDSSNTEEKADKADKADKVDKTDKTNKKNKTDKVDKTVKVDNAEIINSNIDDADTNLAVEQEASYAVKRYHPGEDEIAELINAGYSREDIMLAVDIANEIYVEPEVLLNKMTASNKSLEQIKEEFHDETNANCTKYLTDKYPKEYKKLSKEKFTEIQIMDLLSYIDAKGIQLTTELIKKYKEEGANIFSQNEVLSQENVEKYKLSDQDAQFLSDNIILGLELKAKENNTPVNEMIDSYLNDLKN